MTKSKKKTKATKRLLGLDLYHFAHNSMVSFLEDYQKKDFSKDVNIDKNWVSHEVIIANLFLITKAFLSHANEKNKKKIKETLDFMHSFYLKHIGYMNDDNKCKKEMDFVEKRYKEYDEIWKSVFDKWDGFLPTLFLLMTKNIFHPEKDDWITIDPDEHLFVFTSMYASLQVTLTFPDEFEIID